MRALQQRGTWVAAIGLAAVIAGCGGGSSSSSASGADGGRFTVKSVGAGFIKPADVGTNMVSFEDDGHGAHINFTPEGSVPTCPYVQRADDLQVNVDPAVELSGGNPTGRFIVAPRQVGENQPPIVTHGAVVFPSESLAAGAMKQVTAAVGKCPKTFTVLGGPPVVIGSYTVNARPFDVDGWKGSSQQLAHTAPPDVNPETYDDLVTVVAQKGNAIVYAGFEQIKKVGERADSGAKAEETMRKALERLG
jgi:hypothetical protein